jgi:hypothetical protein
MKSLQSWNLSTLFLLTLTFLLACNEERSNKDPGGSYSIDFDNPESYPAILEKTLQEIMALNRSCEVDTECRVVTSDLSCGREFIGIHFLGLFEYENLIESFETFKERHEILIACNMMWSASFQIENYDALCIENRCVAGFRDYSL